MNAKIKTLLLTVLFVIPLTYLLRNIYPEMSRLVFTLWTIFFIVVFHVFGNFIFSRKK